MTEAEIYKQALLRELYKQSYYDFFVDAVAVLEPGTIWDFNWHHKYLCDLLQAEAYRIKANESKTFDYNINIPPRTSKSLIVSVVFNAWVWAVVDAGHSFLCISHTDELAIELATKTKMLIESAWYTSLFPHVVLRPDSQAKSNFKTTAGGSRVSFSIGSGITGFGADYLLIDDAHKPNSPTIFLEQAVKTYRETLFNRLNNPGVGVRIIIGQRIAENDLSGYIKSNTNGKYLNIVLPMEITSDISPEELAANYTNGVLWNSRFPVESFSDLTDSDLVFATQYLQRPAPVAGNIVRSEWLRFGDVPDITYHFFIDTAETTKKNRDASTILVAGVAGNIVYVKDIIEVFLEFVDLKRRIVAAVTAYGDDKSIVYIEPKSNGKAIVSALREESDINVVELPAPRDSKTNRLVAITPKLESGRVVFAENNTWKDNAVYQITTFPNARQDGIVDTLSYAVNKLLTSTGKLKWYFV